MHQVDSVFHHHFSRQQLQCCIGLEHILPSLAAMARMGYLTEICANSRTNQDRLASHPHISSRHDAVIHRWLLIDSPKRWTEQLLQNHVDTFPQHAS